MASFCDWDFSWDRTEVRAWTDGNWQNNKCGPGCPGSTWTVRACPQGPVVHKCIRGGEGREREGGDNSLMSENCGLWGRVDGVFTEVVCKPDELPH